MSAFTVIARTETRLFLREPLLVFWSVAFPVLLLTIFGFVPTFSEVDPEPGIRVIDVYVPVMILLSITFVGVTGIATNLGTYRERKVLKRLATTPAGWRRLITAQVVLSAGAVAVVAVLVVLVGRAAFAVPLPANPIAYVLVLLLATAAMLGLGLLIGALASSAKVASAVGSMAFFPLMFFGGLWLPVQSMPDVLARISELTPLGAASVSLHEAALGSWPEPGHLLALVAYAAALGLAAVRWFRWE